MVFTMMELEPYKTMFMLDDPTHTTISNHEAIWWEVETGAHTEEPNYLT
jgi:hypothetical protein